MALCWYLSAEASPRVCMGDEAPASSRPTGLGPQASSRDALSKRSERAQLHMKGVGYLDAALAGGEIQVFLDNYYFAHVTRYVRVDEADGSWMRCQVFQGVCCQPCAADETRLVYVVLEHTAKSEILGARIVNSYPPGTRRDWTTQCLGTLPPSHVIYSVLGISSSWIRFPFFVTMEEEGRPNHLRILLDSTDEKPGTQPQPPGMRRGMYVLKPLHFFSFLLEGIGGKGERELPSSLLPTHSLTPPRPKRQPGKGKTS